jgi:hypothetical protein
MRERVSREKIERFMTVLAHQSRQEAQIYFVGGVTAVLFGWRASTVDIDLKLIPDQNEVLKVLAALKNELHINIELAAPDDFIPPLPNWETRSRFIIREGRMDFFHYDFYGQALAKIERGHKTDMQDVRSMFSEKLIEPKKLLALYSAIESEIYKYPALDTVSFRKSVEEVVREMEKVEDL